MKVLRCQRCGHKWARRKLNPLRCPLCKSSHWNKPRIVLRGSKAEVVNNARIPPGYIERFKKSYRNQIQRRYAREHVLGLGGGAVVCGLNKRPHPGHCEVCGRVHSDAGKPVRLVYHYWDDEDYSKGIWLCSTCRRMAEGIDRDLHLAYLGLKASIEEGHRTKELETVGSGSLSGYKSD